MNRDIVVQWEPTGFLSHYPLEQPLRLLCIEFAGFPWGKCALWITHCLSKRLINTVLILAFCKQNSPGLADDLDLHSLITSFHGHTELTQDLSPVTVQLEKCGRSGWYSVCSSVRVLMEQSLHILCIKTSWSVLTNCLPINVQWISHHC
jgi:hypothetical protein